MSMFDINIWAKQLVNRPQPMADLHFMVAILSSSAWEVEGIYGHRRNDQRFKLTEQKTTDFQDRSWTQVFTMCLQSGLLALCKIRNHESNTSNVPPPFIHTVRYGLVVTGPCQRKHP